jgi:hypothetical protein
MMNKLQYLIELTRVILFYKKNIIQFQTNLQQQI